MSNDIWQAMLDKHQVTLEMLEAGGDVVNDCEHIPINDSYEVAARVYEAMVRAREEG